MSSDNTIYPCEKFLTLMIRLTSPQTSNETTTTFSYHTTTFSCRKFQIDEYKLKVEKVNGRFIDTDKRKYILPRFDQ